MTNLSIKALFGIKNPIWWVQDGDLIEVDADKGVVKKI